MDLEKSDSYVVPQGVRNAARRGLEIRRKQPKSKKAGLDAKQAKEQGIGSGVQRASDLMSGRVSKKTIKRMHAFFSRHAKNITLDPGKKPEDDKGYVAGLLWGGMPGKRFAAKMVARFEREDKMKKARKVPKKYLAGLSESKKKERKAEIRRRAKTGEKNYKPLPGDKDAKTKPSKYTRTTLAKRVREEVKGKGDDEFLRAVAKITGISKRILRQVHKRGAAAWSSGHRPGAPQAAWARARVYSFATGGKTRRTADKDLWAKHLKMKKAAAAVVITLVKAKKDDSCPVATQNLKVNTKNRNAAIKASHIKYGPLNVDEPGDYWKDIAEFWETTEAAAKKSKCANCVAFDISPRMDKCMPGETSDDDGRLGYCWMHHFKCHSARSCRTWAKGGPIRKDAKSLNWQKRGEGKVSKSGFVHISERPLVGLAQILKATPPTNKPPKNGGVNPETGKVDKPPKGYQAFGSKRGGFRKPKGGGGYDYWYPGTGHSASHHPDDESAAGEKKQTVSEEAGEKVVDTIEKLDEKIKDPKTPEDAKKKMGEMLEKLKVFAKKAGLKTKDVLLGKKSEGEDSPGKASNTRIILASLGLTTDTPGIVTDRGLLIGAVSLMGTVVFGKNKWVRDGDHWYPGNNKALKYTGTELVSLLLTKMKPEEIAKQLKNGKKKAPEKPDTEDEPQADPSPSKEEEERPEVDVDKKFDQMKVGLGGTFEANDKTYTVENSFTDKRYKGGGYITFTAVDKDGNRTQGIMGIANYEKLAKPSNDDKTQGDAPAPAEAEKTPAERD